MFGVSIKSGTSHKNPLVYARHGHELLGCKSPISEPQYLDFKILQLLAKGNCKAARLCGKEACSKAVSRRTETSYKAESAGKLAHDSKALGSADTVNDAVVLRQFMFLSGEICLTCDADRLVSPGRTPGLSSPIRAVCCRLSGAKNRIATRRFRKAAPGAIRWLIEQKSAEAIVAERLA